MRRVTLGSAINAPKGSLSSNLWLNYQSFSPAQCPFKLATKACRLSLACCRQTNRRRRPVNDVVLPIMEQLVGSVVFRREIASLKRSQTPVWNQSLLWFSCQLTRPVLRLSIFGSFSQRRRFPIQNFNHILFVNAPQKGEAEPQLWQLTEDTILVSFAPLQWKRRRNWISRLNFVEILFTACGGNWWFLEVSIRIRRVLNVKGRTRSPLPFFTPPRRIPWSALRI